VESALWGALAALPLLVGAWLALSRTPRDRTVGLVSAFGAGALLSAVAFELVEESAGQAPPAILTAALALGAFVYYTGDRLLARASESAEGGGTRGLALLLGAALDGIPESFLLGLSMASGEGFSAAFFVAVLVSNFPEGMASAAELRRDSDVTNKRILGMWAAVLAVCAVAAGLGGLVASQHAATGAVAEAFAAGALLTMLIDDLIPEARERGGITAGLVGVLGFVVAFALHLFGG